MKPLTIEQLEALNPYDWVWVEDLKTHMGYYTLIGNLNLSMCGKVFNLWKNKEQAECKGEIVELPKTKWAITRSAVCVVGNFDYVIEERIPVARWMVDRWHFGYEPMKLRTIIETFDSKDEAERRLADLKGERIE